MKILYVAASPVPSKAANSVHVVKMAQALAHNGHQVELMVPIPLRGTSHMDVPVYEFYGVERNFRFTQTTMWPTKLGVLFYALQASAKSYLSGATFIFTRCLPTAFVATTLGIKTLYERHSNFVWSGARFKSPHVCVAGAVVKAFGNDCCVASLKREFS